MKKKTKMFSCGTNKVKIALFQGTFDLINWGHAKSFELCKSHCDKLIVALNSDKLVRSYKRREPVLPYYQKKFIIESFKFVDEVIQANHTSPKELLIKHKANVFCVGSEWVETHKELIKWFKSLGGEIVIVPEFPGVVRTSQIKKILLKEMLEGVKE